MDKKIEDAFCSLLQKELVPAEGCTEPIAIAYAASVAKKALGKEPGALEIHCSGSIVKNAKSAVVPNLGGLKGIAAAAVGGAIGGDPDRGLEVLSGFDIALQPRVRKLVEAGYCTVKLLNSDDNLHIIAFAYENADHSGEKSRVEIKHKHNNIVSVSKNDALLQHGDVQEITEEDEETYSFLSLRGIYEFVNEVPLARVFDLMQMQIKHNIAICEEGLKTQYGAGIGRLLRDETDVEKLACAYAAAGSDARMSGCSMPVVINAGSGNQGITVSAPVYIYAKHLQVTEEKLIRALLMSNLVSIYIKSMIGRLSAYCGAVSAACGSGAGITYLYDGSFTQICHTIVNALVNVSGILCDGAKPSCAAKIASSVQAAILGHKMAMQNSNFEPGDGIIGGDPEKTLRNVGFLASQGMIKIDKLMLDVMLETNTRD